MHREWPIILERPLDVENVAWRSVGIGWGDFVRDHGIEPRSSLVFEVVDKAYIVVSLFPRAKLRSFTKTLWSSHLQSNSSKSVRDPFLNHVYLVLTKS